MIMLAALDASSEIAFLDRREAMVWYLLIFLLLILHKFHSLDSFVPHSFLFLFF